MLQWSSIQRAIGSVVQPLYGARPQVLPSRGALNSATAADLYRVLRAYYLSNGLYDVLADMLRQQGVWREALKPLRNPAYRVTEFYARSLWPGTLPDALPIMAKRRGIIRPIQQVWQWSNWGSTKQVAARHLALYGDLFIKVATTPAEAPERVFLQLIEPEFVTDFDADERDFLTYIRMDVPRKRRNEDGTSTAYTHTEVWNKETGTFRVWQHQQDATVDIDQLGTPDMDQPIESFGIDFIPISHAKFADIGENRGMGALVPAIDKIDEANRQATRLAQMLFRNMGGVWALEANSVDSTGRPLPPPRINETDAVGNDDDGTLTLGDDRLIKLPGMSKLVPMVPNINYDAALKILQDHMGELEQDLPELVWYRLADRDLSGRAVRLMMAPAVKRLEEARGNAEGALIRADQMALTLGLVHGLFRGIGSFDGGAFEHDFEPRDVLPTDELERGQTSQAESQALKNYVEAGMPLELAAQEVFGWTAERAQQFTADRAAALLREPEIEGEPEEIEESESEEPEEGAA